MRQRLTIILTFVVIIGVLVIINTITYVKEEKLHDSEVLPNRSTYHSGPTGTRALHDFLSESGYKVMRWREAPEKLLSETGESVATFVVIGTTRLPFSEDQVKLLRQWISRGGCFVLIDREFTYYNPDRSSHWSFTSRTLDYPAFDAQSGRRRSDDRTRERRDAGAADPIDAQCRQCDAVALRRAVCHHPGDQKPKQRPRQQNQPKVTRLKITHQSLVRVKMIHRPTVKTVEPPPAVSIADEFTRLYRSSRASWR